MAARKSARKSAKKKSAKAKPAAKASSKKSTGSKSTAKKATAKKTAGKKQAATKPAAKKPVARKKAAGAKKSAAKQTTGAKTTAAAERVEKPAVGAKEPAAPPRPSTGGVDVAGVNLGHVFALRPRVPTSFRPDDFREAKERLRDERFATPADAARAVAEKALSLTRESSQRTGRRKRP